MINKDKDSQENEVLTNSNESVFDNNNNLLETIKESETKDKPGKKKTELKIPKKEPQQTYIYYLYVGDSEDEFYTFEAPEIIEGVVYVKNIIKKNFVKELVVDKEIIIPYRDTSSKVNNLKFSLIDLGGVIIKCHSIDSIDLKWVNKTEVQALEEMKATKLQTYDKILPQLLQRIKAQEKKQLDIERNDLLEF